MQLKKKQLDKVFNKLQMEINSSNHHIIGWFKIDGKKTLMVKYSKGNGDISKGIAHKIRRSFNLEVDEFIELTRCSMKLGEFKEIIVRRVLSDECQ